VWAGLVARPEDWRWSSVGAHLAGRDDGLVETAPLIERCGGQFADLIAEAPDSGRIAALRKPGEDRVADAKAGRKL
jgi:REP-associated tyrosine transposase